MAKFRTWLLREPKHFEFRKDIWRFGKSVVQRVAVVQFRVNYIGVAKVEAGLISRRHRLGRAACKN